MVTALNVGDTIFDNTFKHQGISKKSSWILTENFIQKFGKHYLKEVGFS